MQFSPPCFSSQFGRKKICGPKEKIFSLVFHSPYFFPIPKQWKTEFSTPFSLLYFPSSLYSTHPNTALFFKSVCLILGALACDLLLFILDPILGWVIFGLGASILIYILYGSYKQIFEYCQENLQPVSNWFKHKFQQIFESYQENLQSVSNWFEQRFKLIFKSCQENLQSVLNWFRHKFQSQSISQASSQVSNGSLMLTPYYDRGTRIELEEGLTKD